MKATHTTIYTADDGTEYTDARPCAAHEQVLAKGEHAYGTIEFEEARDALAAPLPVPAGNTMKLWLLRPAENLPEGDDPWEPWYDKAFGFVVRAETEDGARSLAHANAGDENRGGIFGRKPAGSNQPWLDAKYSTCTELTAEGAAEMVMMDFQRA